MKIKPDLHNLMTNFQMYLRLDKACLVHEDIAYERGYDQDAHRVLINNIYLDIFEHFLI